MPSFSTLVIRSAKGADVAHPVRYELAWWQERGQRRFWCWHPIPPPGYVSLGDVGTLSAEPPALDEVVCVAIGLLRSRQPLGAQIWNDRNGGAPKDGAFFAQPGRSGLFRCSDDGTHNRPRGDFYLPPGGFLQDSHSHGDGALRFNTPPSNGNPKHPEGENFFWRYFEGDEVCPCEHGACCYVAFCGAQAHGEITRWAKGENKCAEWMLCPCFIACMIVDDRKAIEAKIHEFHVARGDVSAPLEAYAHPGIFGWALCCGWTMAAQNYSVMQSFKRTQAQYLSGPEEEEAQD